jgi:putative transport protein
MGWLFQLHATHPVAQAIGVFALVCVAGLSIGSIKVRGIGLGTAGVLFAGLITGHFSKPVDHATLDFVKEFGLLLFVFTIGLQLGPGFFAALRRDGLRLNSVAVLIVFFGSALAVLLGRLFGLDSAAVLGILSGGTTNTPSLGAAQQTIAALPGISENRQALPALAYAVTYPGAIVGIIATLLALKGLFRIDPAKEAEALAAEQQHVEPLETRTLVVENPNLANVAVEAIPSRAETGVIVSRYRRAGQCDVRAAVASTRLQPGDLIAVVGARAMLDQFQRVVGRQSNEDLRFAPGNVAEREIVVTNKDVLGKTIAELALDASCGVVVSRLTRADLALTAVPGLSLQFGDVVQTVGDEQSLARSDAAMLSYVTVYPLTTLLRIFAAQVLALTLIH